MAKTYIDWTSAKSVKWQFWEFFNMSFNLEKLEQYKNEKWYVNITMSKRKEPGQYWDTHYFTLNEWTPDNNSNTTPGTDVDPEDIPF